MEIIKALNQRLKGPVDGGHARTSCSQEEDEEDTVDLTADRIDIYTVTTEVIRVCYSNSQRL